MRQIEEMSKSKATAEACVTGTACLPKVSNTSVRRMHGFTLVELMTVVTVVAVLSAVAYPSFTSYLRRSRATEAVDVLSQYRLSQEQAFQDNGNYGVGAACSVALPAPTSHFYYSCIPAGDPATGFAVQAIGVNTMASFTYRLDDMGNRTTTAFPGRTNLPAACWLIKEGDC